MTNYIMEDPREARRLAEKVDPKIWVDNYFAHFLSNSHSRILDVGCGPGVLSAEIAQRFPTTSVFGVDASAERIKAAESYNRNHENLHFSTQNAEHLAFDNHEFDLVFCRLMLEYSPSPETVINEMHRVCKPGGHVVLQDLDGQLMWHYPEDRELQEALEIFLRKAKTTGFDPYIGRKLFSFAKNAGFTSISVSVDPYHLYTGRIPDKELDDWELKLDIALPLISEALGEQKAHAMKKRFLEYLCDEDTLTYSVIFTVTGMVPLSTQSNEKKD